MLVAWNRNSCVVPVEIVSFVFLVLFKDGGPNVSPRFHIFVSDFNQGVRRPYEFKIFLRDPRDGKILLRFSASYKKNRECALWVRSGSVLRS